MEIPITCEGCKKGNLILDRKTRRRVIYKCEHCGHELSVKRKPRPKQPN